MRRISMLCAVMLFCSTAGARASTRAGGSTSAASNQSAVVVAASGLLVGNQQVQSYDDTNAAGLAQAFAYTAGASGTPSVIDLYVNGGTTATRVFLGVYSDSGGKPGSLLTSGSIASPQTGEWNDVPVGPTTITQGTTYWIALLGTGGQLNYPDAAGQSGAGASYVEANSGLTSLPTSYMSGHEWDASPASLYVNGQLGLATPAAPSNTALPAISGTPTQGQTLTTTTGTWTNSPTSYAYQWQDCAISCSNISGATSSTYTVQGSDVGNKIDVVVTATNAGGSVQVVSAQTVAVAVSLAPVAIGAPMISGSPVVGQVLTASNGLWGNGPSLFTYQWQDCAGSCSNILGATSWTYALQGSDVGDEIDVVVTARNAGGSVSAVSAQTATVTSGGGGGPAPLNTVAPYFVASVGATNCTSGCAIVGEPIRVQTGSWTCSGGCGALTYTYQWEDCLTTSGQPSMTSSSCVIARGPGATTNTYTVAASDMTACGGGPCSLVPVVTAYNDGTPSTPTTIAGSRCSTGEIPWSNPANGLGNVPSGPLVAGVGCSPVSAQVAVSQAGERFCSNAPSTCGYGDPLAGSVGVAPGTLLTSTGSLSLSSSGCAGLGSPAWCSGSGTSASPWVINAVSAAGISVSGGYWTIQNSSATKATSDCVVCVGGGVLRILHSTVSGVNNTNEEATYGIYNTSKVTGNLTEDGVYVYNSERILEDAGTVQNSMCWENGGQAGSHHECFHSCPGPTRGQVSTNNVLIEPWAETANFDEEDDDTSYCNAQPGSAISSNNDLLIGGGGYDIYPGSQSACGTSNVTDDRFSRYYWAEDGQYGVNHNPGCPTMTWSGNVWDDTGTTVTQTS